MAIWLIGFSFGLVSHHSSLACCFLRTIDLIPFPQCTCIRGSVASLVDWKEAGLCCFLQLVRVQLIRLLHKKLNNNFFWLIGKPRQICRTVIKQCKTAGKANCHIGRCPQKKAITQKFECKYRSNLLRDRCRLKLYLACPLSAAAAAAASWWIQQTADPRRRSLL